MILVMDKNLNTFILMIVCLAAFSCQSDNSNSINEEKTIASTHPKLEEQLARDSVRTPVSSNENPDLYEHYRIRMDEYQQDNRFAIDEVYTGKLAPLDETSHADAKNLRTALRNGLKEGINFAGQYTVVTIGCGTSCQQHFVVDRKNGKILDRIQGSMGAKHEANSRLFILNPPDASINYEACTNCSPEAYIFRNGKFEKVELNR